MRYGEQAGYRNTDTLFLGRDSNQQGLDLENREFWKHSLH
jgi:hypothetical protein